MTLDVRGSLKNTKINQNYYVVIDELLSNAIDSYLIRKETDAHVSGLRVSFQVELFEKELFDEELDLKITCVDNGAGLGNQETKAFVTKDTSYKDDLAITGIGKCKGSGRVQFFHYFSKLEIDSIYNSDGIFKRRTLRVDDSIKEINEGSFILEDTLETDTKTRITLDIIKEEIYKKCFLNMDLKEKFSAESLRKYVMISFLQRLVGLKQVLGDFCIEFKTLCGDKEAIQQLHREDLPEVTTRKDVNIPYSRETESLLSPELCKISHYKLNESDYKLSGSTIALCAKSSIVKLITKNYLKTKTLENNPINGFYHIILIEGDFLDNHVNEQRDDFNLPIDIESTESFLERRISFQEIYDALDEDIMAMLTPPDWDKQGIINTVGNKYGISSSMITEVNVRVHYGDTEEGIVQRVLKKYQDIIIQDTSEIFDVRSEILNSDPNSDEFRDKVNELAWKYTSSLKNIDMANLSQVVVRRTAILEILSLAINKRLNIQNADDKKRQENEKIIHNIFFPMRKDSEEIKDHDIWILNEEYHYYDYIASDQLLSKMSWDGSENLFDSDIDDELSKILQENYENNSGKRPDIAIFNNEGSVIIIEFKAPDVDMDRHIGDLMEYAQLLAAKSNGKLKKFYGYLIGSSLNPNRLTNYTRFPNGQGWFNTSGVIEHSTGQRVGELYSEILFYDDIVDRANKRLDVYKKRLNLDLG
ncbi:hypothetical protein D8Y20_11360 [Mariprofundus sp. EBB-1]|uniref:hypothetical protein n=1 Tax=Mariprofundus sp. EBB-1 TaxID=2650971 RepID=UPI000EF1AE31|nr:hypothetical protein [Mariprofundus sp. EBB-1]RLL50704.1 hypothetical protein D8Y20_11360 [Mariprofundus sp. EBB-1]